jgi:hypothetical protein
METMSAAKKQLAELELAHEFWMVHLNVCGPGDFSYEGHSLKRSREKWSLFILCSFCVRDRVGWLMFVISLNLRLQVTRIQNKQEKPSPGLPFNAKINAPSCFW